MNPVTALLSVEQWARNLQPFPLTVSANAKDLLSAIRSEQNNESKSQSGQCNRRRFGHRFDSGLKIKRDRPAWKLLRGWRGRFLAREGSKDSFCHGCAARR
jgi:hypothetical protein